MSENARFRVVRPDFQYATFTVQGISPLLTNRFPDETREKIERSQQGDKAPRAPRNPDEEYANSIYYDEDGDYAFPAQAFRQAMIASCRTDKSKAMTEYRTLFQVMGQWVKIEGSEPIKDKPRMGRPDGKTWMPIYRMMYPEWKATVTIRFLASSISLQSVANMLELAGSTVGIGPWRPECDGNRGMFELFRGEDTES